MSFDFDKTKEEEFNKANEGVLSQEIFQKGISISDDYIVYNDNKTGGLGSIGLCKNKTNKKFYVLKTYKYDYDSRYIDIFKEEIKFALKLKKHPHIVYSQTALKEKDRVYLVMELVGKQPKNKKAEWKAATLTQELQNGIKIKESYKWAIEFCRGMQYLNSIGMKAHQDIKPDNILITAKRHIKISDFGFVTLKEEEGKTKGWSDYYYSPEHFIEDKELDIRSDIYSFGIVLYEMFNAGENIQSKTQTGRLPRKRKFIEISKIKSNHCNEIIKKCLQPRQEDRYQTFRELERDLLKEAKKETGKDFKVKQLSIEKMKAQDYFGKGNGYLNIEQYEEAIKNYNKIIEFDYQDDIAYHNRGLAKLNLKQYEEAIRDFDKAIEINREYANAYNSRGNIKYILKQYNQAIEDYNKAIKIDKNFAYAYNNRGNVKKDLQKYKEAIKDFDKAIKLDLEYSAAYANRGSIRNRLKQYTKAIEDSNKALKFNSNNIYAYNNRGIAKLNLKQYEEAIKDFDKAIEINTNFVSAYNNLTYCFLYTNQIKKAFENIKKALEKEPNNLDFIDTLYDIYKYIKKNNTKNKNQILSYRNLIEIYRLLGKEKEAKEIEQKLKGITKG